MTIGVGLTIIGIISTIIIGIIGIRYALKYRTRIKLTYLEEDCISLFRSIVQNMDGIAITYEGLPISPNLIMLKGSLVNDGNMDIDESIIHEPVSMILPIPYKWLKAKIVDSSPNVKVEPNIKDESTLEFRWDLLKKNEFFRFDSLIQPSTAEKKEEEEKDEKKEKKHKDLEKELTSSISFSQRITNLDKVEREELTDFKQSLKMRRMIPLVSMMLALGIYLVYIAFVLPQNELHFLLEQTNGNVFEVSIIPQKDNTIKVKGVKNAFSAQLELGELSKYKLTPILAKLKYGFYFRLVFRVFGLITVSLSSVIIVIYFLIKKREKKLMKLMQIRC